MGSNHSILGIRRSYHRRPEVVFAPLFSPTDTKYLIHILVFRMNCVSLDSIGIAGFGHDFGALYGRYSEIEEVFDAFGTRPPAGLMVLTILLGPALPILTKLPGKRASLISKLHKTMQEVSEALLKRSRREKELAGTASDTSRSIIGSLRKYSPPLPMCDF